MSKQEEIIEVAGKKVVVRYTRDGQPCEKCVLDGTKGCDTAKCSQLDRVGMEIDERAYFVEAEQPEADLEAEIEFYLDHTELATKCKGISAAEDYFNDLKAIARHFAEWGAEHLKK